MRWRPPPITGVTGATRASRRKVGRIPPSPAEDEARPEDHVLERRGRDGLLHLPLRVVVGDEVLRLLARAEGAHQHEAAHARLLGGRNEVGGALLHHPAELLGSALPDRDEVDDRVAALDCRAQARGVGHVALRRARSPRQRASRPSPPRGRGRGSEARSRARSAWTTFGPTNPVPPVTRITHSILRASWGTVEPGDCGLPQVHPRADCGSGARRRAFCPAQGRLHAERRPLLHARRSRCQGRHRQLSARLGRRERRGSGRGRWNRRARDSARGRFPPSAFASPTGPATRSS